MYRITANIGDGPSLYSTIGVPNPVFTPEIVSGYNSPEIYKGILDYKGFYPSLQFLWSGHLLEIKQLVIFGNIVAEDKGTF